MNAKLGKTRLLIRSNFYQEIRFSSINASS